MAARSQGQVSRRSSRASRTALEKLAGQHHCPLELVERLYVRELTLLEGEARVQAFVPVVALRRVREVLRRGTLSEV